MMHRRVSSSSIVQRWMGLIGGMLAASSAFAASSPKAPYYHPHRLVQIEAGRRLNLYCVGSGSPVVIFDYGHGGPITVWSKVQPAIGKLTTACAYDRAGYGFSDPGPLPRSTAARVSDLHALLHAAGLKGPYIFVGHSLAGLDGDLFADKYLPELAGMVLVDPSIEGQDEAFNAVLGSRVRFDKIRSGFSRCAAIARSGKLPTDAKDVNDCLDRDPHDDALARRVKDQWSMSPALWDTLRSEFESIYPGSPSPDQDFAGIDAAQRDWGHLPLIILTAGHSSDWAPASLRRRVKAVWVSHHDALAARSSRGRNILVPDSGHYIQLEHPAVVVDAITEVLKTARQDASGKSTP
ncbi:alpha/beta hydrolase [Rhodanobacter sp. DHB23]|uniref:alpha/beta fold hydrolase n=1 Tax=Rhodanobacter sp. DHB23 TaxID=2775923 RepID=UPI0017866401|nr:alpha/beta hydrolase [Rhodanobacter sp. DHB23]MBD8873293.1 alpha/beta hydrolase [Rhodanobacter sp. DHB23]